METTERVPNTGAASPAQPATNDRLEQKPRRCAQPNPGFDTSITAKIYAELPTRQQKLIVREQKRFFRKFGCAYNQQIARNWNLTKARNLPQGDRDWLQSEINRQLISWKG